MGNSHAIWDHTVLPATRQRWESRLYPELKQVLNLATLEGCKAELSCHTWILLLCYWQTGDYVASTDLGSAYSQTSGSDLSASGKTLHCIVSIFLNKTGVKWELLDTVKARKLAYCGHTMRKQGSCLEKEIMHGTMPGAHRRGRPRTAWMDNINTWTGLPVEEWQRTEINGESTSVVWPTLGSRAAKEQSIFLYLMLLLLSIYFFSLRCSLC